MKGKVLLLSLALGVYFTSVAQVQKIEENNVPRVIYKAFGDKYPEALSVEWTVPDCDCYEDWEAQWERGLNMENLRAEDQPKFFHVTYKYDNKDRRDIYYQDGEWLETRTVFNKRDLPVIIGKSIAGSSYATWKLGNKIVFVQKSLDNGGVEAFYKVPVKEGLNKEILQVDLQGNLLTDSRLQPGSVPQENVPKVVFKSFDSKYPFANKVEWYIPDCDCYDDWKNEWEKAMAGSTSKNLEDPDNFYVRFEYKDKSQRSVFYRNGEWMETEIIMNTSELPDLILDAVNKSEYSTWEVQDQVVLKERPQSDGSMEAIYTIPLKGGLKRHKLKVYADGTLVPRKKLLGGEN